MSNELNCSEGGGSMSIGSNRKLLLGKVELEYWLMQSAGLVKCDPSTTGETGVDFLSFLGDE